MDEVRFGVIGVGGMGQNHCKTLATVERARLTAVCDVSEETARKVGEEHGVPWFVDYRELIDSGQCDAVLVATPHYQHPPIGIYALNRGLHLLCEKPIAVTVKGADRLIAAGRRAEKRGLRFQIMFQFRTNPVFRKAKELIDSGAIGRLYRTSLEMAWLRTQKYYASAGWRGTWSGEGGGVLLNQAPHSLDIFTWLGGQPSRIYAQWRAAKHEIEVEDEVFAVLEYPNGARGQLYASVNEVPQYESYVFVGEQGKIEIRGGKILLQTVKPPVDEFIAQTPHPWGAPQVRNKRVRIEPAPHGHGQIIANMVRSILDGESLWAPGAEGINSLELANAIILSGKLNRPVSLPLDRNSYEALLEALKKPRRKRRSR